MIQSATLKAFIPTTDPDRARHFYVDVLGLELVGVDPFAVTVRYGAIPVRLVKVEKFSPAPFTILGWDVTDLRSHVRQLTDAKLTFTRYEGMEQDEDAIWTAPGGNRVAWFRDPDGNVLSLSEHPTSDESRETPLAEVAH